ncbi:[FeFe] hydrogenase H-cluster maturation GTPase HydF [Acetobacteroides hydrogenigenes]|uniref:[FeFe] hydrogenase H-cluster maturation GTPase HydF n=1 Tax=Acetobacteroides hydrogenigenes TaxID=979970 RepID=A0A4R2EVE6_9BACT|nr:[FeFe] hydrogenase H-cluster maturation GTPase HydF [Acetobacteroides hydrogenigenes]TCN73124.1 [FeFe] hydrogenase H-cluster maturation GTPase HydF [Acetobacteroides hydrogenigenes]
MTKTRDNKPHIGIYGRRNNGKSTIINLIAGQDVAIVSNHAGTTTDPVKKSVEILNLGPIVLVDTAGIDDEGELGKKRIEKTRESIKIVDLALLVTSNNQFGDYEKSLIDEFNAYNTPFIVVHNMADVAKASDAFAQTFTSKKIPFVEVSARNGEGFDKLVENIKANMPDSAYTTPSMFKGIIKKNDIVLLITPIDTEAPAGRMILPQVQAIRDTLDNDAVAITLKESAVEHFLKTTGIKPALAVTDSQIFDRANTLIPDEIPLTSFSITLSRLKGPFHEFIKGTPKIANLKDGDRVLILESCTHHTSCDDIGRYKIPRWIKEFTAKQVEFDVVSGLSSLNRPISDYAIVIQCGGCMITRKQLHNRLKAAIEVGIPVTNYGMAIAYIKGIFERATAPFSE